jgi:hypothetical protein
VAQRRRKGSKGGKRVSTPRDDKSSTQIGLSDEERNSIVVSFIKALIDNKVKVHLVTAEEIRQEKGRQAAMKELHGLNMKRWSPEAVALWTEERFATVLRIAAELPGQTVRRGEKRLMSYSI